MTETLNFQYLERRAWAIMVIAFITFCTLGVGLFSSVRWFLYESETIQQTALTSTTGNINYTLPGGDPTVLSPAQKKSDLPENTRVDSDSGSQADIAFLASDGTTRLGQMQVSGGSSLTLVSFRSPRFEWSDRPHYIEIEMQRGRARIGLTLDGQPPIIILLKTPHGEVQLERLGIYSVEVNDLATEVVVREGVVTVSGAGESLNLAPGERTTIHDGNAPDGVHTGERNLIANGDFAAPLSPADWSAYSDNPFIDDAVGQAAPAVESGRNTVHFSRLGRNWGRVGIQQKINRYVRDYQSLKLHLALKVVRQNLLVCGTLGSECPVMVKIEYADLAGNRNEWVQGFYYLNDLNNSVPRLCYTCPSPKSNHILVQQDVWYAYNSPDLMILLNNPVTINTISILAEGHTFESFVAEVELQAGD